MTPELLITLIAIGFLLMLSAFFSGSETAMTAASEPRMLGLEKEGNRRARRVNRIREKQDRMIGALLLGNNLVNILASALATSALIKIFGEAGVFYATIAMTMLVLIFAEVLPKTYALAFADQMAMAIAPIIRIVVAVFAPITEMISLIVRFVLKHIFRVDTDYVSVGHNVQELRGAIEKHRGPEDVTQEQRVMLKSILDLADVDVDEVMTHRKNAVMINVNQPIDKIISEVLDSHVTRIPLWQGEPDNIIGTINVKAVLKEIQIHKGDASKINIASMATEPWFVPETTSLFDQLQEFRKRREHFAMVVDEYGSFMGIVTLEDILEEIVGEIEDETDEIVAGVRKMTNGTLLVEGDVTIRDLDREFEWNLPDEDYSTIAGLILHEAQTIPEVGQSFKFHNFRFDIVRRQRNQITLIRITPPPEDDN